MADDSVAREVERRSSDPFSSRHIRVNSDIDPVIERDVLPRTVYTAHSALIYFYGTCPQKKIAFAHMDIPQTHKLPHGATATFHVNSTHCQGSGGIGGLGRRLQGKDCCLMSDTEPSARSLESSSL